MPRTLKSHIDSEKQLGIRLRQAREEAGLSQRQLAFPGCTAAYISRIEAGARVPSLQMIQELSARLGISREWLATGRHPNEADGDEVLRDQLREAHARIRVLERKLADVHALTRPV